MINLNIDFHIHSKYSAATSAEMEIPKIAKGAEKKGLDIIGTGDALHSKWLKHIKSTLSGDGLYITKNSKTRFIITSEVEDINKVHHLLIFPDIESAEQYKDLIIRHTKDIDIDGRPHLQLNAAELVDFTLSCDALLGPAHAFTPWTSIYKEFNSLKECYQDRLKHIHFLELGLSADTYMADSISELHDITFMSNSDAHSPVPYRLGREFNRIRCKELSFSSIKAAIERKNKEKFILNVGFDPREGKYHESACIRCFLKFKQAAIPPGRRCPECGGTIKKGVKERISELADNSSNPKHRPDYIHIIPLAEVIGLAYGIKTLYSEKIQNYYNELTNNLGSEINILIDKKISVIANKDKKIAEIINKFRRNEMNYDSGGGGRYGRPVLTNYKNNFYNGKQKKISEFS